MDQKREIASDFRANQVPYVEALRDLVGACTDSTGVPRGCIVSDLRDWFQNCQKALVWLNNCIGGDQSMNHLTQTPQIR
jgi:hypothetical protein